MTKKIFFLLIIFNFLFWPAISFAANRCGGPDSDCIFFTNETECQNAGCEWLEESGNISNAADATTLKNPLSVSTPQALIGKVINAVLGIVGSIALLMFVYGGLVWMTSSGSPEKVKQGKNVIIWSAIGLAIIFASYGLVRVLINVVQ
jgi:hypothetical protein